MNWLSLTTVLMQVTVVAAIGLVTAFWFRSAAHRHNILLAALFCMLASPVFYVASRASGLSVKVPANFPVLSEGPKARPVAIEASSQLPWEMPSLASADSEMEFRKPAVEVPAVASHQTLDTAARTHDLIPPKSDIATTPSRWPVDISVSMVWLMGTLFYLLGILRSYGKTRIVLQGVRAWDPAIHAGVSAEAARQLDARVSLRIGTTGKVAGPVVVGIIQPWILIPARYLETLSRAELLQVLIHEGAHALRKDPLLALAQRVCGAMFWWHPLVHIVNQQLTRAREEVCDNFVLTHVEPTTYGATLLRLATISPAMARIPLAIGMFDGRGKLEDRIRGLLDVRRQIVTRVRFVTAIAVFGGFAIFSLLVASARVSAEVPNASTPDEQAIVPKDAKTEAAQTQIAESVDAKEFGLVLTYHGESDKPFYNMTLAVPPFAQQHDPFFLSQQISEEQAENLIRQLKQSQFFEHAKVTKTQDDPTTGPQYLLRVQLGKSHFEESLGWDFGTLMRLREIREALDDEPAQLMDILMGRLDGQRKIWESGEVVNDLKTTLSSPSRRFNAGKAIPVKLELANVGNADRQYGKHLFIRSGSEIVVIDEHGRKVPYLGGGAGLRQSQETIKAGETQVIEDCDLTSFYYLRRPGKYAVSFSAAGLPRSNTLHFEVTPDDPATADGDPIGRLMQLNSPKWVLQGSPNLLEKMRPGRNREELPGWQFLFADRALGLKGSRFIVWVWLTERPASEESAPASEYLPVAEYLGKIARWHAYFYASPEAKTIWPTVVRDVTAALQTEPKADADEESPTVVGTVVSPDGKGVAGIEVMAFRGIKQLEQKFTTNARGEFRVPKEWRETETWLTLIARDGREQLGWFDLMVHGHSNVGQKTDDGSFRLVLLPMNRTIRGRVVDDSGQPLAGIRVGVNQLVHNVNLDSVHWRGQKVGGELLIPRALTDSDGRFEMKLPADTFAWLGTSHTDWVDRQIRATRESDEVGETKLVRAATVAGHVTDSRTGKPLAGVSIGAYASKTEMFENRGGDTKTDANGDYVISGLRSGEYTIQLTKGVYKILTANAYTAAMMEPGKTFRADFSLNVGKRLSGHVVDIDSGKPVPNCNVTCTGPAYPSVGLSLETDEQGEFVFYVPPGSYNLDSTLGRRFGDESTRTVDVPADNNPDPVVLKVGEESEPRPRNFKIFLGQPLDRKVRLKFTNAPLSEALKSVCDLAGMTLELNEGALAVAGYAKDAQVTLHEENPVTLQEALKLLLKPYERLSFAVEKGQIVITTSPPKGLELLAPYPKLHGLSLDISENQLLAILQKQELKSRRVPTGDAFQYRILLGDGHTLIVMFRQDGSCSGIQRVRGEDAVDATVPLSNLVRDFNVENRKLERGLTQPPLTEEQVVAAIQLTEWNNWRTRGASTEDWMPGDRDRTEREFALFKSIAKTRLLPKEAYFAVWTTEEPSPFVVNHVWSIQLFLPSLDGDGFDSFAIRHTKLYGEKIDPKSVAWGEPDADGLSLGAYLSPKKDEYAVGDRVRLRLFVRNDGPKAVKMTLANTSHPMPGDFHVIAETGAVEVRMDSEKNWSEKWVSGYTGGELAPGAVHAFHVPFEIGIGGDGSNKLVGRLIAAQAGQSLQLKVSSSNGNSRDRAEGESDPQSGTIRFTVARGPAPSTRK